MYVVEGATLPELSSITIRFFCRFSMFMDSAPAPGLPAGSSLSGIGVTLYRRRAWPSLIDGDVAMCCHYGWQV